MSQEQMTLQPNLCCVLVSKTEPPASTRENWRSGMMIWASTEPILSAPCACARPFKVNLTACHRRGKLKFCSKIWHPNPGRLLWNMCPWSNHQTVWDMRLNTVYSQLTTIPGCLWSREVGRRGRMAMVGNPANTGIPATWTNACWACMCLWTIPFYMVTLYISFSAPLDFFLHG